MATGEKLARFLGYFSIGLGLAEVAAPKILARSIGIGDEGAIQKILPGLGLRELTAGVGVLGASRPGGWLWSRVAGDAMDLSLLGVALASPGNRKNRVWLVIGAVAGVTVLDVYSARQQSQRPDPV